MAEWLADLRQGLRSLRSTPAFTAIAVVTLALGIGANTAIFSVVNGVLWAPLRLPDADRLVILCETHPSIEGFCIASPPVVRDWARDSRSLVSAGLARDWTFTLRAGSGPTRLHGGIATPAFFTTLGVVPAAGRLFDDSEVGPGRPPVAVLSAGLWRARFGADPAIVGRAIDLGGESVTVIGVLPADLEVPTLEGVEIWRPLHIDPADEEHRGWRGFRAIGRLAAGVTTEQATDDLDRLAQGMAREHPETNECWGVRVQPLRDHIVTGVHDTLLVFLGAVGCVLLIGCANVANLLVARATGRRQELATRAALGAGRGRLVRLLFVESLWIALFGGAAGVLLAVWAVRAFLVLAPSGIPRLDEVGVDGGVLLFATVLSFATSFLFGLAPAVGASGRDLFTALKSGDARGTTSRLGRRAPLMVVEVALALILLIGAGLLGRTFLHLLDWNPGFDRSRIAAIWLLAEPADDGGIEAAQQLFARAVDEIATLPGVESVGTGSSGPLFGGVETDRFTIAGVPAPTPGSEPVARWYDVGPGYFRTLGIPVLRGRVVEPTDRAGSPPVAVVNETLARRHFSGTDPLGQRIAIYGRTMTIVGVVADVPPPDGGDPSPEIYWPQRQSPRYATYVMIRTSGDPATLAQPVRQRIAALDPGLDPSGFTTLDERFGRRMVSPRFNAVLVGAFAATAALLAAFGVYSVIAYAVARRTREIGIRVALGAQRRDVLRDVIGSGMRPILTGLAIGVAGGLALTRYLGSIVVGVSPTDPFTFGGVTVLLAAVGLAACLFPALTATRVDPIVALRE